MHFCAWRFSDGSTASVTREWRHRPKACQQGANRSGLGQGVWLLLPRRSAGHAALPGRKLCRLTPCKINHFQQVDGLVIGGGFPEVFMAELSANRHDAREYRVMRLSKGLPVYAECGGLMYLARSLTWNEQTCAMVGALPADVKMHARPIGRGYVSLELTAEAPWSSLGTDELVRGHEFHYSSLENVSPDARFAYQSQARTWRGWSARWPLSPQRAGILCAFAQPCRGQLGTSLCGFCPLSHAGNSPLTALRFHHVLVNGEPFATDSEGYLLNLDHWSARLCAVARAQVEEARTDGGALGSHSVFCGTTLKSIGCRHRFGSMIKYFSDFGGFERGNNHHLHTMFPIGGPQKQGNRLAGLWKTKGEH